METEARLTLWRRARTCYSLSDLEALEADAFAGSLEDLGLTIAFDGSAVDFAGSGEEVLDTSGLEPFVLGSLVSFAGAEVAAAPFFP
jgi:hypothetical protein